MAKKEPNDSEVRSIYDLADKTGLATSTISRVLNQRGRISMRTRQRVLAAAREAGFKPRMSARQTSVAIVLDRIQFSTYGGFISSVLNHLIEQLAMQELAVEVYTEKSVGRLTSRFIDAVIALTWDDSTLQQLRQLQGVPIVAINRLDLPEVSAVASDHYQSGQIVGEYLIQHGHTRIAFLAEEDDWGAKERQRALFDVIRANGHDPLPEMALFTQHQSIEGTLRQLLAHHPSALFLAGEDLALEGTFILTDKLGVRVPDDLSLIALENTKVSQYTRPPLTTVAQPISKIAQEIMEVILRHTEVDEHKAEQRLLENTLIERESVADARSN
ncbi:MAG: LacI family DNA-binding transcriptional regulator [Planctomycetota bacterium]